MKSVCKNTYPSNFLSNHFWHSSSHQVKFHITKWPNGPSCEVDRNIRKPFSLHKSIVGTWNSLSTTNHKFSWPNRRHKARYESINGIPKFCSYNLLFAFLVLLFLIFFSLFTIYKDDILIKVQFSSFWLAETMSAEGFEGI